MIDVLAESSDERLVDLVKRRLLHAYLPVETPATDDVLVAMGDAVLLEQLECGGKAIISQSNIIGLQANRIAELESRTVTVKLPDDEDGQAYGFGKWVNGKLPATTGTMTISYCEDAWRAAFEVFSSAAGIKWEAE